MAFLFYIVGTIAMCTAVEIKAGEARKKRDSADKDISPALSPTELLLLDMTETDFPVYKADYLYWDGVVLIRKLLIGAVISFMTGTPKSQCVLLILILQISLIIQNKRRPFMKDNINDLEELTLVASTTVLLVGLIAAAKERTDPVFLAILSVAVIGFISGSGILMSWKIIYHWYLNALQMKKYAEKSLSKFGSLNEISKQNKGQALPDGHNNNRESLITGPMKGLDSDQLPEQSGIAEGISSSTPHGLAGNTLDQQIENVGQTESNEKPVSFKVKGSALRLRVPSASRNSSQSDIVDMFLSSKFPGAHSSSLLQIDPPISGKGNDVKPSSMVIPKPLGSESPKSPISNRLPISNEGMQPRSPNFAMPLHLQGSAHQSSSKQNSVIHKSGLLASSDSVSPAPEGDIIDTFLSTKFKGLHSSSILHHDSLVIEPPVSVISVRLPPPSDGPKSPLALNPVIRQPPRSDNSQIYKLGATVNREGSQTGNVLSAQDNASILLARNEKQSYSKQGIFAKVDINPPSKLSSLIGEELADVSHSKQNRANRKLTDNHHLEEKDDVCDSDGFPLQ